MNDTSIQYKTHSRDSEELVDVFYDNLLNDGIAIIPAAVSPDACDAALEQFKLLEASNPDKFYPHRTPEGLYVRIINLHQILPSLLRLFSRNPISLGVQDKFFGSPSTLYTSLYFQRGSGQAIHRDTPYFCTRPEYRYLGVWTALEDTDEDNGPLQIVRGGHVLEEENREAIARQFYTNLQDIMPGDQKLWDAYQLQMLKSCHAAGLSIENVCVKKGTTVIWHPQLPHGGAPIKDATRTRNSLVCHVTQRNAAVHHMDAFFNPNRSYETSRNWRYRQEDDRDYIDHGTVTFNHQSSYGLSDFTLT